MTTPAMLVVNGAELVSGNVNHAEPSSPIVPSFVFIVPYRNREKDLFHFKKKMAFILEDIDPAKYKICVIHQKDARLFNRGAIKNIGFLYIKQKYPDHWRTMTLVFNDVDTTPTEKNMFDYTTQEGIIKHFYGFTYALGGIVSITGADFDKIGGFPNFWAWGYEDSALNRRAVARGLTIDRSQFIDFKDKKVENVHSDIFKKMNNSERKEFYNSTKNGVENLTNVVFTENESTGWVDVLAFETGMAYNAKSDYMLDLRNGEMVRTKKGRRMGVGMNYDYGHFSNIGEGTQHPDIVAQIRTPTQNVISQLQLQPQPQPQQKYIEMGAGGHVGNRGMVSRPKPKMGMFL